ncbi:MAG: selenocysteine-specific translation elongation factor [Anaerovoracaceae bacterium]
MKNVIVGTAGHIDHGKTYLIKALTDIDTDRLKEEKQRGITIELGFADMPNDREMDIGIIDVPGHEKFVRHMLAGIGGIDIVLLIVAADEGFMPQTREHFEILKMLDIRKGIVVVTKKDLVDEEWLEVVREDIRDNVAGTFLEDAPVFEVSSYTGEGIDELKEMILDMAETCEDRRTDRELMRMPIDRVFTISGFGTVITGTMIEGSVRAGDEVMIYPSERKARVRNVQVHGQNVEHADAGQRTAVNLSGIKREEIARGNVMARAGSLDNTRMIDVRITMFDNTGRLLKNGSRVHFYCGSMEALCKVVILDGETIGHGESCYAQLRFEENIVVRRGDRFILRFYSPVETIGGGRVLDPSAEKKKRFDDEALAVLRRYDEGSDRDVLLQMFLEASFRLEDMSYVMKKAGGCQAEFERMTEELAESGELVKIGDSLTVHRDYLEDAEKRTEAMMSRYHADNPVSAGMPKGEFREKLGRLLGTDDSRKAELMDRYLLHRGIVEEKNGIVMLKGFTVTYDEVQKKMVESISDLYEKAGIAPPTDDEASEEFRDRKLARKLIDSMCASGTLTRLNHQYCIFSRTLDRALAVLRDTIISQGSISLAQYRDGTGSSRKYAVMILEYADERNITRMVGDVRVLCSQEESHGL